MKNPSKYQQAIFDWIERGTGNATVDAVAGSGKTSTIIEAAQRIPSAQRACFLAFNKHIAEELGQRLPPNVSASTLNSMGFRLWRAHVGYANVDAKKLNTIVRGLLPNHAFWAYGHTVIRLCEFVRLLGVVPQGVEGAKGLEKDTDDLWAEIAIQRDLVPSDVDLWPSIVKCGREALRIAIADKHTVDFCEQIYFPVIWGLQQGSAGFDWVFIDEVQDCDAIQRHMVGLLLKPGGRIVGVGDQKQSLYRFRGADVDSLDIFTEKYSCTKMPLSICYRCPTSHLELAQKLVPWIEARDNAPEGTIWDMGSIQGSGFEWESLRPTDLLVCRNNAPLVSMAYALLSHRIACRILGRDIAGGITTLIKKTKASDFEELDDKLDTWMAKEKTKLKKRDPDADVSHVEDKVETIRTFMENSASQTIEGLLQEIESLFSDDTSSQLLTLSTVHKAKGLTVERCFILEAHLLDKSHPKAKQQDVQVGKNIKYVALTRATDTLGYIRLRG